ncbi:unnamed protein product [Cuscuta epithymum]|uniref:Uncharacterized protein n=1 Tax=Cuscuta epithymum TaxID=186058 RepID=A0AAV0F8Z3_9ASTE|nr:unnamed protein product [Cuscuta epithymum]
MDFCRLKQVGLGGYWRKTEETTESRAGGQLLWRRQMLRWQLAAMEKVGKVVWFLEGVMVKGVNQVMGMGTMESVLEVIVVAVAQETTVGDGAVVVVVEAGKEGLMVPEGKVVGNMEVPVVTLVAGGGGGGGGGGFARGGYGGDNGGGGGGGGGGGFAKGGYGRDKGNYGDGGFGKGGYGGDNGSFGGGGGSGSGFGGDTGNFGEGSGGYGHYGPGS